MLGIIALLIWGTWLGWEISPDSPGVLILIIASLLASFVLTETHRLKPALRKSTLVILLMVLIVFDGLRSNHFDTMIHSSGQRTWIVHYSEADLSRRDHAAAVLDDVLQNPPSTRPSRMSPTVDIASRAHGHPRDSLGLLGLSYNAANYGGFMIKPYWEMVNDPIALEAFTLPWTPWVKVCDNTTCSSKDLVAQFDSKTWSVTNQIRTTRYGQESVDYEVNVEQRTVFVENEINFPYWQASDSRVTQIQHDGIFRAWVLEPGEYSFTARYSDPSLRIQALLLGAGILTWLITILVTRNWNAMTHKMTEEKNNSQKRNSS